MTTQHTQSRDQYFVFEHDGNAWCEMFYDGQHVTAPTPYYGPGCVANAMARLAQIHPDAIIDEMLPEDIADAMRYAS